MGTRREQLIALGIAAGFAFLSAGGFLVPATWQPLHGWLITFFRWPDGSVWSNLLAWVICGGLAFFWTHRVIAKHHRVQMAKLEAIHAHLRSHAAVSATESGGPE